LIIFIEIISPDQLFPMPSGRNPTPYANNSTIEQHEFFRSRKISPPGNPPTSLAEPQIGAPRRQNSIPRKPVPSRRQQNESTDTILHHSIITDSPLGTGAPPVTKDHALREQINHTGDSNRPMKTWPMPALPSPQARHFLGRIARLALPSGSQIKEAIAISYQ
jgi:hypothetical protein